MYVMVPALSGPKNRSRPGSPKDKHDVVPVAIFFSYLDDRHYIHPWLCSLWIIRSRILSMVRSSKIIRHSQLDNVRGIARRGEHPRGRRCIFDASERNGRVKAQIPLNI